MRQERRACDRGPSILIKVGRNSASTLTGPDHAEHRRLEMAKSRNSKIAPVGKRFGRVTVCGPSRPGRANSTIVSGRCDCGDVRDYFVNNMAKQRDPMCPTCRLASRPSKGMHRHPLFNIWKAMIQRCENPRHTHFRSYGGRGISICDRWANSFESFFADMGNRPSKAFTLDRIDNDLGYAPNNCRWATRKEQMANARR